MAKTVKYFENLSNSTSRNDEVTSKDVLKILDEVTTNLGIQRLIDLGKIVPENFSAKFQSINPEKNPFKNGYNDKYVGNNGKILSTIGAKANIDGKTKSVNFNQCEMNTKEFDEVAKSYGVERKDLENVYDYAMYIGNHNMSHHASVWNSFQITRKDILSADQNRLNALYRLCQTIRENCNNLLEPDDDLVM